MVMALVISAVTVPATAAFLQRQRARNAARLVERELQTARLKAVTISRSVRVRFACPAAGQMRLLELTGVATTDNAANRCDPAVYPSPGPADLLRSTPQYDSPVIMLPTGTTVTGSALQLEFNPRGTVYTVASGGVVSDLDGDLVLTVTRENIAMTITINGLGRVRLN
jgi:Tfp pilus assembly protein FimT